MSSNINVSPDNPYGQVTIPRAKLRLSDDLSTVIANPGALSSTDPYSSYVVKDAGEEEVEGGGRCPICCYRCRRKK